MNEEASRCVEIIRHCSTGNDGDHCKECPYLNSDTLEKPCVNILFSDAADLIESLSEQLEQVTRERDAAVKDLKLWYCFSCNNRSTPYCQECSCNRVRLVKGYLSGRNHYEWRGVEVEG